MHFCQQYLLTFHRKVTWSLGISDGIGEGIFHWKLKCFFIDDFSGIIFFFLFYGLPDRTWVIKSKFLVWIFHWRFHHKRKFMIELRMKHKYLMRNLFDGMFSLGILLLFKLLNFFFLIHWLSEYSVNVFQFSINDFVLILVGNTIALKTQKSSFKKNIFG